VNKICILISLLLSTTLTAESKVLAFAGSTRHDSYNKKLVHEAASIAKQMGAAVTVLDLNDYPIPLYDEDLESTHGMPLNAKRIRDLMIESQAIIIASPEYNASIPAVLKNVIDWASRDEASQSSRAAFKGKKFAIMSASPSPLGGKNALVDLKAIIEAVGGEVVQVQTCIPDAYNAFDAAGHIKDKKIEEQLKNEIKLLEIVQYKS